MADVPSPAALAALPPAARHAALLAAAASNPARPAPITDEAALASSHRFLRTPADDAAAERENQQWLIDIARSYESRLFKEYAIADLSRARTGGGIGLRWRTAAEVRAGKGQLACGARGCGETRGLASFEVPFRYVEAGERRAALVKCRLCPQHAADLAAASRGGRQADERASDRRRRDRDRSREGRRRRERSRSPDRHERRRRDERRRERERERERERSPPPPPRTGRVRAADLFDGLLD